MIHTPRFRGHLRVVRAEDGVTLVHETGAVRLQEPLLRRLAPLIDGRTPAEEIARRLQDELSPVDVAFGLSWLEERGWVVEAASRAPCGLESLVDVLGLDPREARRRLQDCPVALVQAGQVPVEPLERALRSLGVRVDKAGGEDGLTVVVTDDYLREDLAAHAGGPPWMLVKPVGALLWIGPLFDPRRRGCWRCLAERLRPWRRPDAAPPPQPAAGSTVLTGLALAATEALRWVLQGTSPAIDGALVAFEVRTLESARHAFAPVPGCPVCGAAEDPPPAALTLASRAKVFTPGGGDRAATPEAMLRRYGHLVSPITGIVDRLTPSLEHDLLHIYTAGHVDPPGPGRDGPRVPGERRLSAGRGITPAQARAAALCESLERHSGFFRGTERRIAATREELGSAAVHPNDCLRISDCQYAGRDAWNRLDLPFHWIPEPFDERRPTDWTPAWSLTRAQVRWLPAAYCFYDYPLPAGHRFCRADSNGCAAGSCLEEAILQGFFEIVERDALALWWYNRAPRPGVRLESFRQPYFTALREALARLDREVWALDLTADLGIPAFAALSREVPARPGDVILGAGAHLDPAVALAKALTEVNQCLPGFLSGRPRPALSEDPGEAPYLRPDPGAPPRGVDDFPVLARPDLKEEVELCVERARERGLEVLVVDQTREDVGLPVARVVVPGMRLFRARFAPGRLYDVPVELGWKEGPLRETELNPVHILI